MVEAVALEMAITERLFKILEVLEMQTDINHDILARLDALAKAQNTTSTLYDELNYEHLCLVERVQELEPEEAQRDQ